MMSSYSAQNMPPAGVREFVLLLTLTLPHTLLSAALHPCLPHQGVMMQKAVAAPCAVVAMVRELE